jgi:hypothetical protein
MGTSEDELFDLEARKARRQDDVPDRLDEALEEIGGITSKLESVLSKFDPAEFNRIFLSHAGVDKPIVRPYMSALRSVGLDPWLDEENMPAGTSLHRGLLQGLRESCAAVFFLTPNFKDESFLRKEIDYAVEEERQRSGKFKIISLLLNDRTEDVPALLQPFVWKKPKSELEAFIEIIRALPVRPGPAIWRQHV